MIDLHRISDIGVLMQWRTEVLCDVFDSGPTTDLLAANFAYYHRHITDGTHMAYVATFDGIDAGCGAVCFYDEMPSPDNSTGRCAYLMNIYVRPPYRNKGIATTLVKRLIEESRQRECGKIYLETTEMGKPIYKALGFNYMKGFMKYEER